MPLNDARNLETAIKATNKEGGHVQVAISYTTGPVYTTDYFVNYTKQWMDMGVHSICLKDMRACLSPTTQRLWLKR